MNKTLAIIVAGLGLSLGGFFGAYFAKPKEPNILKPSASAPKPKRYIVFNKKRFEKKPGDAKNFTMSAMPQILQAKSVKELENINGAIIETDLDLNKNSIKSDEWEIQEEYHHHILGFSCSRCETIPCPTPTPQPQPTPTPTPTPPPPVTAKSWGIKRVHALEAQAQGKVDTSKVKVCVVDTGADLQHPQRGTIVGTKDFTGKGTAQDGNGHGTHTAGTIAGLGGVGVARSALYICKGLDDGGSGSSSALAQCLNWCGAQGAQIVSNSWGSSQSDPLINQAINQLTAKGIYVIVAAGNDGRDVNWPAKLAGSNPLVFAIAASDQGDRITSFSSRGPEIRFISPGASITSNWPGGGTKVLDGTSMATPHVAGICAFGIAKGIKPCVKASGAVGGYPMADALETVR